MREGVRITLSGTNPEKVDWVCRQIREISRDREVAMSGPIQLPTIHLRVPVRKGPDGCGTSSIDHWEMRLHKRLIEMDQDDRALRIVLRIPIPDGVNVEIKLVK